MMRRFLIWFTTTFLKPPRVILANNTQVPYLSRYYLYGGPKNSNQFDAAGNPIENAEWKKTPFTIMLHRFHRSDDNRMCLHSHPFRWMLSLILAGGYCEEYRENDDSVSSRVFRAFSFNYITSKTLHRVDLIEDDAWSILIVGPRTSGWFFWDRHTKIMSPWREFLARERAA